MNQKNINSPKLVNSPYGVVIRPLMEGFYFNDMPTKTCTKCHEEKLLTEFFKGNDKIGLSYWCKDCYKKWREENPEKVKISQRKYDKKRYEKNPEKVKTKSRKWQKNNPEKRRASCKKYYEKNSEKINIRTNEWVKKRLQNNPMFKLNRNISTVIWKSLKDNKNGRHWENLVGYKLIDLRKHLESKFKKGMNWSNYGKWHIDHILPISRWNITSAECKDFKRCWALKNLQPLWEKPNLSKGNKIIESKSQLELFIN